uniref:CSON012102 protein n=1 Tax=Culicoides sonorensis TaxID=179676 RepID=A0A336M4N8_CULSO
MKRKIDDLDKEESADSPINMLFTENLEKIFTYLTGTEMITCRLVCVLWNDLLCNNSRLLPKSVGIHLRISKRHFTTKEIPELEIMREKPALKLTKITVDAEIFLKKFREDPWSIQVFFKLIQDLEFVSQINFKYAPDLHMEVFEILFDVLAICRNVKKIVLHLNVIGHSFDWDSTLLREKWAGFCFESVEEVIFEHKFIQNDGLFQFYAGFCCPFKNLKRISGIIGFDALFYGLYRKQIKSIRVFNDEFIKFTEADTEVLLEKLEVYDFEFRHEEKATWNYLNEVQTQLKEIKLKITYPAFYMPNPVVNYGKVKALSISGDCFRINQLYDILPNFKNIEDLKIKTDYPYLCNIMHQPSSLLTIKNLTLYARKSGCSQENQHWFCHRCLSSMFKTLRKTNKLVIDLGSISMQYINLIGRELINLEKLIINFSSEFRNLIQISVWPQMSKLKEIKMPYNNSWLKKSSIIKFCAACPNLRKIYLANVPVIFVKEIQSILVENLEHLETFQFNAEIIFVVKEIYGKRMLKPKENTNCDDNFSDSNSEIFIDTSTRYDDSDSDHEFDLESDHESDPESEPEIDHESDHEIDLESDPESELSSESDQ